MRGRGIRGGVLALTVAVCAVAALLGASSSRALTRAPAWKSLGWVSVDIAAGEGHGKPGTLQVRVVKMALKPFTEGGPPTSVYVTYELRAVGETAPVFVTPDRIAVAAPVRFVGACSARWHGLCIVPMSSAIPDDAHSNGTACDTTAFPQNVMFDDGSCFVTIKLVSSPMRQGVKLKGLTMVWQPWEPTRPIRALTVR
jgi:hypothetical protein